MKGDIFLFIFFLIFSITFFTLSKRLPEADTVANDPSLFPMVYSVIMFFSAAAMFIFSWLKRKGNNDRINFSIKDLRIKCVEFTKQYIDIFLVSLSLLLAITLLNKIGFLISSIIYSVACLVILKLKNKKLIAILSIVVPLLIFTVFKYALKVDLP